MITVYFLVLDSIIDVSLLQPPIEKAGASIILVPLETIANQKFYLSSHDVLVILLHDDNQASTQLDREMLLNNIQNAASHFSLKGTLVLNLSNIGGGPGLATLFLEQGALYYTWPVDKYDYPGFLQYAFEFFSFYFMAHQNVQQAHQQANKGKIRFFLDSSSIDAHSRFGQFHPATSEEQKSRKKNS
ncbi:hypothetical protein [Tengunoibacter tsumagoiensis]|uniref:Uncharacterized protein n=1 Tax=Tengunoibacter tsumagoiensis TaxID=2014871 RepID=A0A401ZXN8_9CHLR|nr:hypothetical protein [Tengunoibacter tsumagoiensis]GCE11611.1 hypothetical protein KTT_14700 [Tengunoibacter tsumagoiensis]